MDSVFWTLSIVLLCFNLGFSYGFNDPLRLSVPLPLVHSGHLVKRNPQSPPTGASENSALQGSPQQNRPPSMGTPNQEAAQPRSDLQPKSVSSSSTDSKPSKPALASKPRLSSHSRNSKIHKSSRPPKPDLDKASLSDESPQFRAQLPRRIPGRPGPPGTQPERQHSHSHGPSAHGAHSHGPHVHGPAHHGPHQHQPGLQSPPALPAGNPPGIVEVEPGAHMPPRHPSDIQMGGRPPIVVMTPQTSKENLDPNPLSWEEIRVFLNKPVLSDLFAGLGSSLNKVTAVFRKLPMLLEQMQADE